MLLYRWIEEGGDSVTKMGRPTEEPRDVNMRIRISEKDREVLEKGSRKLGITMAEFIRRAIHRLSEEIERS